MEKFSDKTRLENLIKSNQSLHTICKGEYILNFKCSMFNQYSKFKCNYEVDTYCTYNKFLRKIENDDKTTRN